MAEKSTFKEKVIPKGPKEITEPEKELRFTRSAQAYQFYISGVVIFALSMSCFILSTQDWGIDAPLLKGWLWLCLPGLIGTYTLLRLGLRCTRHAYIIISPLGIEIFPFFNAKKNLQLVYWAQINNDEIDAQTLKLHFNDQKTGGVIASLNPISHKKRPLLKKAIDGVMQKQKI